MCRPPDRLFSHNTSGVHGMRLRRRHVTTRTGQPRERLVIDLFWRCDGKVHGTSVEVGERPLEAVQAAQLKRYEFTGDKADLTPRAAWLRMRRALEGGGRAA